jgi:hypothetical protein
MEQERGVTIPVSLSLFVISQAVFEADFYDFLHLSSRITSFGGCPSV